MINPHKIKYFPLYWSMVEAAAPQSVATRHKVGAIVVTPTGMISVGWNGMPSGMDNNCESTMVPVYKFGDITPSSFRPKTNPEVIHAERNAIDKMTRQGVPTQGSILFVSRAPCFECSKALHGLDINAIYYRERHDDMRGVKMLQEMGIVVQQHFTVETIQELNQYYK